MNNVTKDELNRKLKEMLRNASRKEERIDQSGQGNIIHRRKGRKDKRFSTGMEAR